MWKRRPDHAAGTRIAQRLAREDNPAEYSGPRQFQRAPSRATTHAYLPDYRPEGVGTETLPPARNRRWLVCGVNQKGAGTSMVSSAGLGFELTRTATRPELSRVKKAACQP